VSDKARRSQRGEEKTRREIKGKDEVREGGED
jgi:hypothetical protein